MKLCKLLLLLLGTVLTGQAKRPNIVLIMADDLGFSDLGCYGSEIETRTWTAWPKMDWRFSQFYNTAKCHSSRVSLLTGLYCDQAGSGSLSRGATIAEVLKPAGYSTWMSGKWHLSKQPTDFGFQRYWGHLSGACNFFTGDNSFRLNGEQWTVPKTLNGKPFYTTHAITDFALDFVKEGKIGEDSIHSFYMPCLQCPPLPPPRPSKGRRKIRRWQVRCRLGSTEADQVCQTVDHWSNTTQIQAFPEGRSRPRLEFDQAIGKEMGSGPNGGLCRHDRRHGPEYRAANPRIGAEKGLRGYPFLFCADNGGCPFERTRGRNLKPWDPKSYWTYDASWAQASNTPFRLYKQNQHEGGISSPLIVHWPKGLKTKPGSITRQPGHLIDFMATFLELSGAKYPKQVGNRTIEPLEGKSLVPIFQGQEREGHENLYFHFGTDRALRQGKWKLVSAKGGKWELYDLEKDRTELNDLSAKYSERVKKMSKLWFDIAKNKDRLGKKGLNPVKDQLKNLSFRKDTSGQVKE